MTTPVMLQERSRAWPVLPWREWEPTITTLHMWTQIVGKIRMALMPPRNHWWHVTLYVSSRGLTTLSMPYGRGQLQIDLDFVDHIVRVDVGEGDGYALALEPMSVARFYHELMAGLHRLGIDVHISTKPVEVEDAIPFESDEQHAAYDPGHVALLWRALLDADRVMKTYQSGFVGKASPVHFFWGSFDLATTRYSGRPAPLHPGGVPNCPDWVMEENYSREEASVGWWPSSDLPGPQFYSYTYPEPTGYRAAQVVPAEAYFDTRFGEFALAYDAVREAVDPDSVVLDFFRSTYEAGADLGGWDRAMLEPAFPPTRPAVRPWSIVPPAIAAAISRTGEYPGPGHKVVARRQRRATGKR